MECQCKHRPRTTTNGKLISLCMTKPTKMTHTHSQDSDQLGHSTSLVRVIAVHMGNQMILALHGSTNDRFYGQAYQSLRFATQVILLVLP